MYDGNNYDMTQTSVTFWVIFLSIAVVLTFAMISVYLYAVYRACETTKDDGQVRLASPEPAEGILDGDVARSGGERELAHAGAGAGDPRG